MQSLTNRGREVERKPMNIWEKMYIPAIAKGMAITFGHMFKRSRPSTILSKQDLTARCSGGCRY